jgi:hypothetical protein
MWQIPYDPKKEKNEMPTMPSTNRMSKNGSYECMGMKKIWVKGVDGDCDEILYNLKTLLKIFNLKPSNRFQEEDIQPTLKISIIRNKSRN